MDVLEFPIKKLVYTRGMFGAVVEILCSLNIFRPSNAVH